MARTFCLDANLSFRVAKALAIIEHPVIHVASIPGLGTSTVPGQQNAEDEDIAKWCATTETTLVTADEDFRGRWVRSGALMRHGTEVIVFKKQLVGLDVQHRIITVCLPGWHQRLDPQAYAHRVWEQDPGRKTLEQMTGRKPRKSRKGSRRPPVRVNP